MALIEIDGLPINSMVIFHGELLVITRGKKHLSSLLSDVPTRKLYAIWILPTFGKSLERFQARF